MTYVVCQTPRCRQTYPMSFFGVVTRETKNISCEKCGGVLVGENGEVILSRNAAVIPVITAEEIENHRQRELTEKQKQVEFLNAQIKALKREEY